MAKSWNLASTRINNSVVFLACSALVVLSGLRNNWQYVVPFAILAVNAGFALAFWSWRLRTRRGKRWLAVALGLGHAARVAAITSGLVLFAIPAAAIVSPSWGVENLGRLDTAFWLVWSFAVLEIVHGHVYALTLGTRSTLEYVVTHRRWSERGAPSGGVIGRQLRILRERDARRADREKT